MNNKEFYTKGKEYWENIPATIDGMLGGYSNVLNADVQASSRFLSSFLNVSLLSEVCCLKEDPHIFV